MIEPLLRRLIQHERRKSIVIIVTILTGLLVVLPAADEYNAARGRVNAAKGQLLEIQSQANDLPHFQKLFQVKSSDLQKLESKVVSESVAERLQNELVEMVRQSGCTMRLIRPGDPLRRDWTTKDHAVRGLNVTDRGESTPYQLETRQISLSVTGSMPNVLEFLARIHRLDRFIHSRQISLKRADVGGNTAILDMDLVLFNLIKKPVT